MGKTKDQNKKRRRNKRPAPKKTGSKTQDEKAAEDVMNQKKESGKCWCGLESKYEECCELVIKDQKAALTAEQLMRSRFSAYCTRNLDFILQSCHESTRPKDDDLKQAKLFMFKTKFFELQVASTEKGGANDTEGFVHFEACFLQRGRIMVNTERSKFEKVNDVWFYVDGTDKTQSTLEERIKEEKKNQSGGGEGEEGGGQQGGGELPGGGEQQGGQGGEGGEQQGGEGGKQMKEAKKPSTAREFYHLRHTPRPDQMQKGQLPKFKNQDDMNLDQKLKEIERREDAEILIEKQALKKAQLEKELGTLAEKKEKEKKLHLEFKLTSKNPEDKDLSQKELIEKLKNECSTLQAPEKDKTYSEIETDSEVERICEDGKEHPNLCQLDANGDIIHMPNGAVNMLKNRMGISTKEHTGKIQPTEYLMSQIGKPKAKNYMKYKRGPIQKKERHKTYR